MSKLLKIAVVSDLHCRHGKENVISTHLYTETPRIPKEHHPVEALKLLIEKDKIEANILLCPGDITDKADKQGLISGWGFIKEISKKLHATFYTSSVGNHDVNSHDKESNPFQFITTFHPSFPINNDHLKTLFWSNDKNYFLFESDDFVLLNFNSAFNHIDADRARKSLITDEILEKINDDCRVFKDSDKIKIALFHHHPQPYANIDQAYKDGDLIERGGKFLELLQKLNFDIVIHGHKHLPKLEYFNGTLPFFCAGSFSSTMNVMDVSGKNTFHLIQVEKHSGKSKGTIQTWEFTKGHGWLTAKNDVFFPSVTGFGCNVSLSKIEGDVIAFLNEANRDLVQYTDLISVVKELEYLTPLQQEELTASLLKHNIEFFPSLKLGARLITKQLK